MSDSTNLKHKDWETMSDDQKEWWRDHMHNWRSWGSWFSWGSPVGLGLGWALFIIPLGIFIWLWHLAYAIH